MPDPGPPGPRQVRIGIAAAVDPSTSNMGYITLALTPEERARRGYLPKSGSMETARVSMDASGTVSVGDRPPEPMAWSGSAFTADVGPGLPAGLYPVSVRVRDGAGNEATTDSQTLVVYDPSAGFVTGSGWINSPPGAYTPNPTLTGKAKLKVPPSTSSETKLRLRGAGIANAHTIRDIDDFKNKGLAALEQNQLAFFICKVEESLIHREIPRPNTDLAENKYTFVRYLERTEEKAIPFVGRG